MKDLPIPITNESFDLLTKQSSIIHKGAHLKREIHAHLHNDGNNWTLKTIDKSTFSEIGDADEVINKINSKINEIHKTNAEIKNKANEEQVINNQIASLESKSKFLVWVVAIVIFAIVAYFVF